MKVFFTCRATDLGIFKFLACVTPSIKIILSISSDSSIGNVSILGISTSSYIGNVSILDTFNPSFDGNTSILSMSICVVLIVLV
ncbi:hypothetical protein FDB17_12690 [Clostridium botulinum]|nr:hypothetical protein [Clostridium botulinum]NFU70811.1 hypothetical protein [Clostridium botulinum]